MLERVSDLPVAAHEGGQLGRQVVGSQVQRPERWQVGWQTVRHDLVQVLGHPQVLEPVCTQVTQGHVRGQLIRDQGVGGGGHDDLAAMRGAGDPRGAVDGITHEVAADPEDLATVEAHPDPDRPTLGPRF